MIILNDRKQSGLVDMMMRSITVAGKSALQIVFLIVATLCSASTAHAAYTYLNNGQATLPAITFPAEVTVPYDPAVGTVIASAMLNQGIVTSLTSCPVSITFTVPGGLVSAYANTYKTNLDGIGVRYTVSDSTWTGKLPSQVVPSNTGVTPKSASAAFYVQAELVVTGPVTGGTVKTIPSMTVAFASTGCVNSITQTQPVQTGTIIKATSCSVSTPSLSVALPPVFKSSLRSVGSTWGGTNFSIGVNCTAAASVSLTLSDATTPSNTSKILSAAAGSTARGVGFQISSGGTVLSFGPVTDGSGQTPASWSAGQLNIGANTIPLSVSYIRTGPLESGTLQGLATFTMTYQ